MGPVLLIRLFAGSRAAQDCLFEVILDPTEEEIFTLSKR
jgi:hypothetical protein